MTKLANRIIIDDNICNGKPVLNGKRITVQSILEFLAAGDSREDILKQFPSLVPEDIEACLKFAANILDRQYIIKEETA